MTMSADLFRREALEYWSGQRGPAGVLRVGAPWVRWLYWVVLALLAAGLALSFLVRIDQTASGPTLVDPQHRTFVAVLPADASSAVQAGRRLRLEVDGPTGRTEIVAQALHADAAADADIRRAGFGSFPQPAVLVTGVLGPNVPAANAAAPTPSSARLTGRAVMLLGSRRASSIFLRGFVATPDGGSS